MRFRLVFTFVLVLLFEGAIFSQDPSWSWAESGGSLNSDYGNVVCTDADGFVYVTGTFQGATTEIGSYTLNNSGEGSNEIFIAKYDVEGNVLWAISEGGPAADWAYGICTDNQGNVLITGYFQSPTFTIGTSEFENTSTNSNCYDIFIAKYDTDGNFLWADSPEGLGCERATGVDTDSEGNAYLTGYYWNNNITFDDHTLFNLGAQDGFLTKYDVSGNMVWATRIAGSQIDLCEDIFVDTDDNILVTGSFENSAQFGDNTVDSPNQATYQDIFAAKFDSEGNNIWAECVLVPFFGNYASGKGIVSDTDGNIYMTGYFQYSLSFGEDTLSTPGNIGLFLAKFDGNGNALWGRTPGGTGSDYGVDVCVDSDNHVFVTGYFTSSFLNFGGIPVINSNTGYNDAFIAAYNADGDALWASAMGEQDHDYGMNLASGLDNEVFLTGYFSSYSVDFSNTTVTNSGSHDFYLAKLSYDTALNVQAWEVSAGARVYPNPFANLVQVQTDGPAKIEIYDMASRKVFESQFSNASILDLSELVGGVYVYRINRSGRLFTGKMIKK